jgi:hypothetical protein
LEIRLEGANGKLPNLDILNSLIKICRTLQFKCSLDAEKWPVMFEESYHYQRPPLNYVAGIHNMFSMVFKQATGVPSSMHAYFLEQRIEALTISGGKHQKLNKNKKIFKQNILKLTRFISI